MLLVHYAENRENNFNLIRLVAALLVIVSHSYILSQGVHSEDPFYHLTGISLGAIAVDVFFITSGFLVTASLLHRKNLVSFVVNRFLRIFPGLLVALIFTAFIVGLFFSKLNLYDYLTQFDTYHYFFKNLLLFFGVEHELPGVFEGLVYPKAVNGSLWTLPWELRMYAILFVIGVLIYVFGLINNKHLVSIFFIISISCLFTYNLINILDLKVNYFLDKFARLGGFFLMGSFLYVARDKIIINRKRSIILLVLILLSAFNSNLFLLSYSLFLGYLILALAYLPKGKILKFNQYGDYSYGLYIYAFPIQQSVIFLYQGIDPISLILVSSVVTFIFAFFSWKLVEKPMLSKKDSTANFVNNLIRVVKS